MQRRTYLFSDDQFRRVYFQGHPEYDANSLLKEYKREVLRHFHGERDLPPFPEHYISDRAAEPIARYLERAREAHAARAPLPEFPEAEVGAFLKNTWAEAARRIFDNWLGLVARLTNPDRRVPLRAGVDPRRPLDALTAHPDTNADSPRE